MHYNDFVKKVMQKIVRKGYMHYNDFVKIKRCMQKIVRYPFAYGQKPYDDINYYESANYMFLTKSIKRQLTLK